MLWQRLPPLSSTIYRLLYCSPIPYLSLGPKFLLQQLCAAAVPLLSCSAGFCMQSPVVNLPMQDLVPLTLLLFSAPKALVHTNSSMTVPLYPSLFAHHRKHSWEV